MTKRRVWDELDDLLDRFDADVRIEGGSGCAWSGQVRLTLTEPPNAPSRSMTFHSVGGAAPDDVGARLLDDVAKNPESPCVSRRPRVHGRSESRMSKISRRG
jgi:hypothetical protein